MYFLVLLLSLFMVARAVPLIEQRAPPQQYRGTYTFITSAPWPCYAADPNAELVVITVEYRGHILSTEENGIVIWKTHQTSHGQGVGEVTGTKYQLIDVDNNDVTWTSSEQHVRTVNHFKLIEQGSGQVFYTHANVKFTYDPINGVVYEIEKTRSSCE